MKFLLPCGLVLALSTAMYSLPSHAVVTNGSLTQTNSGGFLVPRNSDLPPGWNIVSGTPDVLTPTANAGVGGLAFPLPGVTFSPDGGTWVGLGRDDSQSFLEAMAQTLSGLVVGERYQLSWYAGNFGMKGAASVPAYQAANAIQVQLQGVRVGAGGVLTQGPDWVAQSLQFTAVAAQQELRIQLDLPDRAYLSIDGIEITAVAAVPKPAPWALMLLALGAGAAWRVYGNSSKPASATTRPLT